MGNQEVTGDYGRPASQATCHSAEPEPVSAHGLGPSGECQAQGEAATALGLVTYPKHLATCGSVGMWGKRSGTTVAYCPRAAWGLYGEPWFRFRNAECEAICREAWREPAPTRGEMFEAVDAEGPTDGWAARIDATDDRRKCSLVRWEGAALPFGRARFYHYDGTDLYQWHITRNGFEWSPAGRVLRSLADTRP